MKLFNSFSLNMLPSLTEAVIFEEVKEIPDNVWNNLESYIGHKDLANILNVKYNRTTVKLKKGEKFIIAQYIGNRLPEGCTKLPHGSKIKFVVCDIWCEPDSREDDAE